MIAADTNLIIRYLLDDDAGQAEKVRRLFDECESQREPVFLSQVVLCELCWVLEAAVGLDKRGIVLALEELLADATFVVQERIAVEAALADYRRLPGQFADHLIGAVARQQGCTTTWTFDRVLARSSHFKLLK